MSTFLELCQDVAADSGTMTGGASSIATTVDQIGRAGRIVGWVKQAWHDIQTHRPSWMWMQKQFEAPLIIGQGAYSASDLSLARVSKFLADDMYRRASIYETSKGVADEGYLRPMTFQNFVPTFGFGEYRTRTGKPQVVSVGEDGLLNFWPKPDVGYTARGWYKRTPQVLSADSDVPEMPEEFHPAIKWRALILLATYDQGMEQYPMWLVEYRRVMHQLERDQLPEIEVAGTLA